MRNRLVAEVYLHGSESTVTSSFLYAGDVAGSDKMLGRTVVSCIVLVFIPIASTWDMSKSIVGEAFGSEFVEFRRLRSILYYISMTEWKSYACIICCVFVLFLFIGLRL